MYQVVINSKWMVHLWYLSHKQVPLILQFLIPFVVKYNCCESLMEQKFFHIASTSAIHRLRLLDTQMLNHCCCYRFHSLYLPAAADIILWDTKLVKKCWNPWKLRLCRNYYFCSKLSDTNIVPVAAFGCTLLVQRNAATHQHFSDKEMYDLGVCFVHIQDCTCVW